MTTIPGFYTVAQAAVKLGIHTESARRLVREGKIATVDFKGRRLIEAAELDEFAKTYDPGRKSPAAKAAWEREQIHTKRRVTLGRNIRMLRGE